MSKQGLRKQLPAVAAFAILALGVGGVALAQRGAASATLNVTLLDGKLRVTPAQFVPGKVTFLVTNRGNRPHALAVMGASISAKRTPTLASGKQTRLTLTLRGSMYHVWDPVTGSMSKATMLMPQPAAPPAPSSSPPTTTSPANGGGAVVTPPPATGAPPATGGGNGGGMPGMDPGDPCAGMGM